MYREYNPNPVSRRVGDCAVRAIAKALDTDWETAYIMLVTNGFAMGDMPSSDSVWGATLRQHGFYRESLPNDCPDCYTAEDFMSDHPNGTYVLGFGGHVARSCPITEKMAGLLCLRSERLTRSLTPARTSAR